MVALGTPVVPEVKARKAVSVAAVGTALKCPLCWAMAHSKDVVGAALLA